MDIRQAGVLAVAIPVALFIASVATWAACRWWYGRQIAAAAQRLAKSEKGRLFSQQQTAQARQQITQLKADLEAQQQLAAQTHVSRRRAAQVEEALQAAEREPAEIDGGMMPLVSAHGFADTQVLPE
jgi:sRNA-binding protein